MIMAFLLVITVGGDDKLERNIHKLLQQLTALSWLYSTNNDVTY